MESVLQAATQVGATKATAAASQTTGVSGADGAAATQEAFETKMTQTLFSMIMNLVMKEIGG